MFSWYYVGDLVRNLFNLSLSPSKKGQGKNVATKTAEKLGYKIVERPKRPSHTRMIDYLDENK